MRLNVDSLPNPNLLALPYGEHRHPCPQCERGPRDDALAIKVDDRGATWLCHRCGLKGSTPRRAYTDRQHIRANETDGRRLTNDQKRERMNRLWRECVHLDDQRADPVVDYLVARVHGSVLARLNFDDVRAHPNLDHFDADTGHCGAWPCMVALIRGPDGRPVGLHRTWVDRDGRKAPVRHPKKSLSAGDSMAGGAIRLMRTNHVIALAEGIETALAHTHLRGVPTWACVSATMLTAVQLPDSIHEVHIAVDVDPSGTGQAAAKALSKRLSREGRRVVLAYPTVDEDVVSGRKRPETGFDWADAVGGA
jgi:putative DNA primase/helicase